MKRHLLLFSFLFAILKAAAQIPLYSGTIPNSTGASNQEEIKSPAEWGDLAYKVSIPTITPFLAPKDKANGTAVIIFPGGGYGTELLTREGSTVAKAFNNLGITAFVVKYRLPDDRIMKDRSIGPLQDAQQAVKTVREKAAEWNIDPKKIGVIGFSAGGHLASTVGTHFDKAYIPNSSNTSLRPDFMILVNPVISFSDSIGHSGSRQNLLGKDITEAKKNLFSNELHVTKNTPPTFLVHSAADVVVPVENSTIFYQKMRKHGALVEMHIYSKGEHGFLTYPSFDEWFGRTTAWLKTLELL